MRRAWLAVVLVLVACERTWTTPVAEVNCGSMKLRFEERGRDRGWPSGSVSFTPALLMSSGSGWKTIDGNGSNMDPSAYARLMPAAARFHLFPGADRWSQDLEVRHWVLFLDPAIVDGAQYEAVSQCIDANFAAIDAAWGRKRPPDGDYEEERRPHLIGMLRMQHRWDFTSGVQPTLGKRWECPDRTFIKTSPPFDLSHCDATSCTEIAEIRDGGTTVAFQPRFAARREFYGTCRDANGRLLYEDLTPLP